MNRWKVFAKLVLMIGIILTLTSCGQQEPVTIGFVASLTGSTSELGVNGRNGLMMAIEEINATGGINGRSVEVVVKDDKNDPQTGLAVDQELYEDGISFIIGHMTSNMAALSIPFVNSKDMLMISPTMSATTLFNQDDHLIGVVSPNSDQAVIIKESMVKNGGGKKVAVIYESQNLAYTGTVKDCLAKEIEPLGGQFIYEEAFLSGANPNYLDISQRVLNSKPDSIVILASSFDAAMFCQQFYKQNNQTPVYLAAWSMNNDLLLQGGQSVEDVEITSLIDSDSQIPAYTSFREKYLRKYGSEPTFAAVYTYEAAMVLFNAMAESNSDDPETIKKTIIKKGTYQGLQSEININEYGDASRTIYQYVVKDGQFKKAE
ncbi:MAG: ABC transporter substrate-binding protein [Acetobacterium sp.]|uniref:ABC transporter substrate-binding protein n=1 Tax=Acetobacterium sp. TaxID=1872094 RepID=UPI0032422CF4